MGLSEEWEWKEERERVAIMEVKCLIFVLYRNNDIAADISGGDWNFSEHLRRKRRRVGARE